MPTVVAKGATALSLDKQYSTPHGRWASLKALRSAFNAGQDGVTAAGSTGSLNAAERNHLRNHWFDAANDIWMVMKPKGQASPPFPFAVYTTYEPSQPDLDKGARVLTAGLIQALECSLGLAGPNDAPPLAVDPAGNVKVAGGLEQVDVNSPALMRNLPVDVYWVCGKLDGFEVQVSWNPRQVTCFILTPQVAAAADDFKYGFASGALATLKKSNTHKQGMLVTTIKKGAAQPETIILAQEEGGVDVAPLAATTTGG
jgi:hypothetical protein